MASRSAGEMKWYRCSVSKEDLARLNQRSDWKGGLQTIGFLGVLGLTGTAAYVSAGRLPWYIVVLIVYIHGACWSFMVNGFHELIHDSVFKTRALNRVFLVIFSFLGRYSHVAFWASHTEHHKFTLHPPDDLEVVLPQKYTLGIFLRNAIVAVLGPWHFLRDNIRLSLGRLKGEWEHHLFDGNPGQRQKLINWARFMLVGHIAIAALACYFKLWMLLVVFTLAPYYGGGLQFLCNAAQHTGLRDNVMDFRLCCRTIYLHPIVQFLYWHMNYHTEHHMYAAVPCYNLSKLHRIIKHDMPPCPRGLFHTWQGIIKILKRQKIEPGYQYTAELPGKPAVDSHLVHSGSTTVSPQENFVAMYETGL